MKISGSLARILDQDGGDKITAVAEQAEHGYLPDLFYIKSETMKIKRSGHLRFSRNTISGLSCFEITDTSDQEIIKNMCLGGWQALRMRCLSLTTQWVIVAVSY